jgi:FixJ family two-component response regulator
LLIAVIDDDDAVRESVAGLVTQLGCRVEMFASASEFLAFPELLVTSCIITDVQMPQMSGIELHDRLRAQGYNIPTILVTGYPDEEARTRALACGVICYLSKPFDKDDLLSCVRTALQA